MFIQRSYTTNIVLFTTKQIQIIDKKNIIIAALEIDNKMFIIHIAIKK